MTGIGNLILPLPELLLSGSDFFSRLQKVWELEIAEVSPSDNCHEFVSPFYLVSTPVLLYLEVQKKPAVFQHSSTASECATKMQALERGTLSLLSPALSLVPGTVSDS